MNFKIQTAATQCARSRFFVHKPHFNVGTVHIEKGFFNYDLYFNRRGPRDQKPMSEVQYSEAMDKRGERRRHPYKQLKICSNFLEHFLPQFRSFKYEPETDVRGPIFGS